MKFDEYLTEIGNHPSHMTKDHYYEILDSLENLTDKLRDVYFSLKKYQLDREIKSVEKMHATTVKFTMAFSKKYSKKFDDRPITGFRSL